ncbi:MAG: hypothetical protein ACTSYS_12965 [Promethearchaeota archaeon]
MKVYYSLRSATILDDSIFNNLAKLMKNAGVTNISILGYKWGSIPGSIQDIKDAARILEKHGFEHDIIFIPVGHPGNALDPNNKKLDLEIPKHWRYRVDRFGNEVKFCADIEPRMIQDNVNAIKKLKAAGFSKFFMDDDIRLGNHGNEIQGCFCDHCIKEFNKITSLDISRKMLSELIEKHAIYIKNIEKVKLQENEVKILNAWMNYNCSKLTNFMAQMALPGIELGIMIMHGGDERHGIDIKAIKNSAPNCSFRVGEEHFNDRSFSSPKGKTSEANSIMHHLNLIGKKQSYSETTIFPANQLSPKNWTFKAKMAIALGVKNLYLMGGSHVIEKPYWLALEKQKNSIKKLVNTISSEKPTFPAHVLKGDCFSSIEPPQLPFIAGIPASPIRLKDIINIDQVKNKILFILNGVSINQDQENYYKEDQEKNPYEIPAHEILKSFKKIIIDKVSLKNNEKVLSGINESKIHLISRYKNKKPISTNILAHINERFKKKAIIQELMMMENQNQIEFPFITNKSGVAISWFKNKNIAILINLKNSKMACNIHFKKKTFNTSVMPLEFKIINLQ